MKPLSVISFDISFLLLKYGKKPAEETYGREKMTLLQSQKIQNVNRVAGSESGYRPSTKPVTI